MNEMMDDPHQAYGELPDDAAGELTPSRLEEIEHQLKRMRPCPPQLDLAAIELAARQRPSQSGTLVEVSPARRPSARRFRHASALAGSWICGAVVGAAVMFLLNDRAAPTTASAPTPDQLVPTRDPAADTMVTNTSPMTNVRDDPSKERKLADAASHELAALNSSSSVYQLLLDDLLHQPLPVQLRAGSYLSGVSGQVDQRVTLHTDERPRPLDSAPAFDRGTNSQLERDIPHPPATRDRLMRELLPAGST